MLTGNQSSKKFPKTALIESQFISDFLLHHRFAPSKYFERFELSHLNNKRKIKKLILLVAKTINHCATHVH